MSKKDGMSRRHFVSSLALTGAGLTIVPRHVLGRGLQAPSDTVNLAIVGIGGMGASNAQALFGHTNLVAFCDVDDTLLENKIQQWQREAAAPPAGARQGGAGARGGGAGGGGRQGATPPPAPAWKDFGVSKAQTEANAKWALAPIAERRKKFLDEQLPKLKKYRDYREMLAKQTDIDGIVVATPDHMHAIIASAAMDVGKHVYVQKPLCWSVHEARYLAKKAADKKVVSQMGNQGHSNDGARRGQDYLTSGVLGEIREVHVWTNRPLGYWPQGVPRPSALNVDPATLNWRSDALDKRLAAAMFANIPVPRTLDWDLFLGVAPKVEYHPIYHPFAWRGWVDYGQGALGDMGAHLVDHPVWGLKLGLPTTIETISTPFNKVTYPNATTTYYEFAARQGMPAVKMVWYDGGLLPPRPAEMGEEKLNPTGGVLYIGSKGKMLQDTYGENPRLLPYDLHNSTGAPAEKMPRIPHSSAGHEMNWVNAIRGKEEISSPFSYASHLTEIMLLGVAALRAGTKLHYDGANMKVTNNAAANQFLTREYREGWKL
jgi:predicted dehydrogenase